MKTLLNSLKSFILFSVLLGIIYPLIITGIARLAFPNKANGGLVVKNGRIVGSELIGQTFNKPEYFNGRPSAVDYNAAESGASNLGPSSKKLISTVEERIAKVKKENDLNPSDQIPADMVLTSASGLDPHISIQNALLQINRISKTRSITKEQLRSLITKNMDDDFIGIWGSEGVNVLRLNLALDNLGR